MWTFVSHYIVHQRANVTKDELRNQAGRMTCPVDVSQTLSLAISVLKQWAMSREAIIARIEAMH